MKQRLPIFLIVIALATSGCSDDERLARMAEKSLETQRQQNEMIARQSQAVVAESAKLAETAKALVEQEAQARNEILAAQRELQNQATVIENERRELMDLRVREPVIAESLKLIGGIFLCCVPLALVGMLLWPKRELAEMEAQLNHYLIHEISAGESSLFLSGPDRPLLESAAQVGKDSSTK
jgi:hypothetical protein